jgi:hypothetical protein
MADKNPPGDKMAYYRVYLLNAADHIFAGEGIERDSDAAALVAAVAFANAGNLIRHQAIEIWNGARKVSRLIANELDNRLD